MEQITEHTTASNPRKDPTRLKDSKAVAQQAQSLSTPPLSLFFFHQLSMKEQVKFKAPILFFRPLHWNWLTTGETAFLKFQVTCSNAFFQHGHKEFGDNFQRG